MIVKKVAKENEMRKKKIRQHKVEEEVHTGSIAAIELRESSRAVTLSDVQVSGVPDLREYA
jgi:hypothetical protein